MTYTSDGWANEETAAVATFLEATRVLRDDVKERINALASEATMDAGIAAAGAEVRAAVLGLRADVADGQVSDPAPVAFFSGVGDLTEVVWAELGEKLLLEVVTGS